MAETLTTAEKAEFDRARKSGETIRNSPFAVVGASCRDGRLTVELNNGVVVTALVSLIPELTGATSEQLEHLDWDQEGLRDGLYWEDPDVAVGSRGLWPNWSEPSTLGLLAGRAVRRRARPRLGRCARTAKRVEGQGKLALRDDSQFET